VPVGRGLHYRRGPTDCRRYSRAPEVVRTRSGPGGRNGQKSARCRGAEKRPCGTISRSAATRMGRGKETTLRTGAAPGETSVKSCRSLDERDRAHLQVQVA